MKDAAVPAVEASIFREYDIRGQVTPLKDTDRVTLSSEVTLTIGRALGSRHREGAAALVTGDNRTSTPALRQGLAKGLAEAGLHVQLCAEEMPTGGATWLALTRDFDVVVQVTGSHTPPHFNGLKVAERQQDGKPTRDGRGKVVSLFGAALKEVHGTIETGSFRTAPGKVSVVDGLVAGYQAFLVDTARRLIGAPRFRKKHRVVLDPGNGLGASMGAVLEELGVEVDGIFMESDGTFPNHPADPLLIRMDVPRSKSGVRYASERVTQSNALGDSGLPWIGVLTDGDGDRLGLIDELGRPVAPEVLGLVFYRRLLGRNPEALAYLESLGESTTLAWDVRATSVFEDMIEGLPGVNGAFIPAGYPKHRAFGRQQLMRLGRIRSEANADNQQLLDGLIDRYVSSEASGHYCFALVPGDPDSIADDGLLAALHVLSILDSEEAEGKAPLATLIDEVPSRFISEEIRLDCSDDVKFRVVEETREAARSRFASNVRPIRPVETLAGIKTQALDSGLVEVDGIRVQMKDGSFFLVRASNTTPMLTFRFEGVSPESLAARYSDVYELLKPHQASIDGLEMFRERANG